MDNIIKFTDNWESYKKPFHIPSEQGAFMQNPLGGAEKDDRVNHPSHYTKGKQEVIETIEEAIEDAPSVQAGMLQAQVLKYMLRCWLKDNPLEDLKKAQWYLTRLINSLN